jgi:cell division septation protein DedD
MAGAPTSAAAAAEAPPASAAPAPAPVATTHPTPATATPGTTIASGLYAVHVSSVKSRAGAERDVASYGSAARPAFLKRTEIPDKGTWWRVYVGPFEGREEAERVAAELRASGREYAQVHKVERSEIEDGTGGVTR